MATPEPARHDLPSEQVVGGGGAAEKWKQEADQTDRYRFFPLQPKHRGIEFGAGQKSKDNGADTRQKLDPGFVGAK